VGIVRGWAAPQKTGTRGGKKGSKQELWEIRLEGSVHSSSYITLGVRAGNFGDNEDRGCNRKKLSDKATERLCNWK